MTVIQKENHWGGEVVTIMFIRISWSSDRGAIIANPLYHEMLHPVVHTNTADIEGQISLMGDKAREHLPRAEVGTSFGLGGRTRVKSGVQIVWGPHHEMDLFVKFYSWEKLCHTMITIHTPMSYACSNSSICLLSDDYVQLSILHMLQVFNCMCTRNLKLNCVCETQWLDRSVLQKQNIITWLSEIYERSFI